MAGLSVRELRHEDINHILPRLWSRGRQEVMVFGFQTTEVLEYVMREQVGKELSYCAAAAGVPVSIFGAIPQGAGVLHTWFLSTDDFVLQFRPLTRALRRMMDDGMNRPDVRRIETYSACIHPLAEKWFSILGMREENTGPGQKIRLFVRGAE